MAKTKMIAATKEMVEANGTTYDSAEIKRGEYFPLLEGTFVPNIENGNLDFGYHLVQDEKGETKSTHLTIHGTQDGIACELWLSTIITMKRNWANKCCALPYNGNLTLEGQKVELAKIADAKQWLTEKLVKDGNAIAITVKWITTDTQNQKLGFRKLDNNFRAYISTDDHAVDLSID